MDKRDILLVEGKDDRGFFVCFCNRTGFRDVAIEPRTGRQGVFVEPCTPKDFDAKSDGWINLLNVLKEELERLGESGNSSARLGVVIDCDYPSEGGFQKRFSHVKEILDQYGYHLPDVLPADIENQKGFIFRHQSNELSPVGLWIMPNNQDDGALEQFVESLIVASDEQRNLLQLARDAIARLPTPPMFTESHSAKALMATWNAWQKSPRAPFEQAIKDGALDLNCEKAIAFKNWLREVFA